jgi:hypothetical protein
MGVAAETLIWEPGVLEAELELSMVMGVAVVTQSPALAVLVADRDEIPGMAETAGIRRLALVAVAEPERIGVVMEAMQLQELVQVMVVLEGSVAS